MTEKSHLQIALALIWCEGEILIAKRAPNADHLPNVWEFPGGKIEAGETPAMAAIREAHEETGLEIEVITARDLIEWEYETRRVTLYPFDCKVVGGNVTAAQWRFLMPQELNAEEFPIANRKLIFELQNRSS